MRRFVANESVNLSTGRWIAQVEKQDFLRSSGSIATCSLPRITSWDALCPHKVPWF
jgi:hypothetical protein